MWRYGKEGGTQKDSKVPALAIPRRRGPGSRWVITSAPHHLHSDPIHNARSAGQERPRGLQGCVSLFKANRGSRCNTVSRPQGCSHTGAPLRHRFSSLRSKTGLLCVRETASSFLNPRLGITCAQSLPARLREARCPFPREPSAPPTGPPTERARRLSFRARLP